MSVTLGFQLTFPLVLGTFAGFYMRTVTLPLLLELCGTQVRAAFWMRVILLAVLLGPFVLTLSFAGGAVDQSLSSSLRQTLLLSTPGVLLAVGAVARVLY